MTPGHRTDKTRRHGKLNLRSRPNRKSEIVGFLSFYRFCWTRVRNQLYYFQGPISETGMSRDSSKRPTTSEASISTVPKIDQKALGKVMPEGYEELPRLDARYLVKE